MDTFIRLEDQTFFTEVKVNVTPHTVWLTSDVSLTEMSQFTSTPMGKLYMYTASHTRMKH